MSLVLNRAKMTLASAPGAGTMTLANAVAPFQSLVAAGAIDGQTYSYLIEDGGSWEAGDGVYSAGASTLTRSLASSSTGSLLNASSQATVAIVMRAEQVPQLAGKVVATGVETSLTVSNIPGWGNELEVVCFGRSTNSTFDGVTFQFNSLATAIYSNQRLWANGGSVAGDQNLGLTQLGLATAGVLVTFPGTGEQANQMGHVRLNIVGYGQTTFWKSGDGVGRQPAATTTDSAYIVTGTFEIDTLAALTSVTAKLNSGAFVSGSTLMARVKS